MNNFPPIFLFVWVMLSFAQLAHAHDPGLSTTRLQVMGNEIVLQATFARTDVDSVVTVDLDGDGEISDAEVTGTLPELEKLAARAFRIGDGDKAVSAQTILIRPAPGDAVVFKLRFPRPAGASVQLVVPILAQMARGHRQYLTIYSDDSVLLGQYILDAQTSTQQLDLRERAWLDTFRAYVVEGVWHIWIGFDHILFLLTLLIPAVLEYRQQRWRSIKTLRPAIMDVCRIVTAFTVAHSVTLALATLQIVQLSPQLVEPVIAFSVLVSAANNLRPVLPGSRWMLAFIFGLVHGFGFAGVLGELGLPGGALAASLLGFNLGVEVGQLAIVALLLPLAFMLRHTRLYHRWVLQGGSIAASLIAAVWMFERIFGYEISGI